MTFFRWLLSLLRRGPRRVYYAHSMRIYGSVREAVELAAICKRFPGAVVVNPATIPYDGNGMTRYLREVEAADTVVFSTYKGHVGRGVFTEVEHAARKDKAVYHVEGGTIRPWDGAFEVIDQDWSIYFAKVAKSAPSA